MDAPSWSQAQRDALAQRGLTFETFEAPAGALSFVVPQGWRVDWRTDHAVVRHGVPPKGHLTVYPIPGEVPAPERLLAAFLDEFVAPAAQGLNLTNLGALPGEAPLHGARFSLNQSGKAHEGVALTYRERGLSVIAAYWVEADLFRKELVTSLLQVVLGSLQVGPNDPMSPPLPQGVLPVDANDLWTEHLPERLTPHGDKVGRFALRLPAGWTCTALEEDGERVWLLLPPDTDPAAPDVLVTLTSEDLYGTLQETMHEAALNLDPQRQLRLELPVVSIERGADQALVRLFVSHPEGDGPLRPPAQRLWSAGWSDGASVVHLVAIGEANRLHGLMPDLTVLASGLKVLPRPVDLEGMQALEGVWRHHTHPNPSEKQIVAEHRYHLNANGEMLLEVEERFVVEPDPHDVRLGAQLAAGAASVPVAAPRALQSAGAAAQPPEVSAAQPEEAPLMTSLAGTWDLVGSRLTFRYEEGSIEVRTLDSQHGNMALVEGTLWQRVGHVG